MSGRQRSWLVVPAHKREAVAHAAKSGADVIVLDLVELIADEHKPAAREKIRAAVDAACAGGAAVFVQIDPAHHEADLDACVWPGLSGIVVSRAESVSQ